MRCEWDERARENARHYINTANSEWTDAEFFESGRHDVEHEILTDPGNVFQGRDPKQMIVLDIGCGGPAGVGRDSDRLRLLRPGGLFKFQVQGETAATEHGPDTWLGVPFTDADAVEMAQACGFEPRYRRGADSQYFWLWFFKPQTFSNKPSLPEHRQESAGSAPPPHGS